ncbi:amino acid ABC transporter permease [Klebsiella pneumoniae]|nr:amino acid ABC transporter permease [Klebsiella pneumoniae]
MVLIILYNFSYLYDTLSLGIPFTGVTWASYQTINVLGQFSTAVVGLTLVQSAYTAEIIRGGFLGVDHGQYEAAAALGATRLAAHVAHYSAAGAAPPSCPPASTRSSVWPRERRWCTSWRCRNCSTPSR